MATELHLAMKAIDAGRKVLRALTEAERPAWLAERLKASVDQVNQDMTQVTFAICRAFVAHALGRDPSADEVDAFIASATGDPAFPARAHRLLGELRKDGSTWRSNG
jgi:hypothetical protein